MLCPSVFYVPPVWSVYWNAALDSVEHCRMSLVPCLRTGCLTAISQNRITMKLWVLLKQLIEKSRVELQTLERLEEELFRGEDAQFVKMKGFEHALDHQIESGGGLHI